MEPETVLVTNSHGQKRNKNEIKLENKIIGINTQNTYNKSWLNF